MIGILVASQIVLWVLLLGNLLLTMAIVRKLSKPADAGSKDDLRAVLQPGTTVPDFEAEMVGGAPITARDVSRGHKLFIFVTPTCEPCRAILSDVGSLARQAAGLAMEVLIVCSASQQDARQMVAEHGLRARVIVAPQHASDLMMHWGIATTPQFVLIEDGVVRAANVIATTVDSWKELRARLAAAEPVPAGAGRG